MGIALAIETTTQANAVIIMLSWMSGTLLGRRRVKNSPQTLTIMPGTTNEPMIRAEIYGPGKKMLTRAGSIIRNPKTNKSEPR